MCCMRVKEPPCERDVCCAHTHSFAATVGMGGKSGAQFQRTVLLRGLVRINLFGKKSEADPDVEHAEELRCLQWSLHCRLLLPPS